jgi:PAS domain S-box-containing protein
MKKNIPGNAQEDNEIIIATEDYQSNTGLLTNLFNYSVKLTYVPFSENILMVAANELKKIFDIIGVTISLYNYDTSELTLKYSTFSEKQKGRFTEMFGLHLEGMRFKVSEEMYQSITSDRYVIVGKLHEITLGTVSPLIGNIIEKVFGIGWFAGISLQDKNRLIGTAVLIGKKNTKPLAIDEIKGFAAVTANALSRWLTEQKALVNELRFKVWAENIKDILWQTDNDQKIVYISPSGFKILGYQPEEMLNKNFLSFITEKSAEFVLRTIKMRKSKKIKIDLNNNIRYEIQIIHKTGRYIWTEIIASPLYDSCGNLSGFQGIARDVTERKEAELKIKQQVEDLKKINAEKDKFFSIIAHDLKGLLHGFVGYSKFIAERIHTLSEEKLAEYSKTIYNTAINLNELLVNLLEWSMIQRERIQFSPKEYYFKTIIEKNIKTFEQQAKNKEISIICSNVADQKVFIDYQMINTVIRNILSNAIKFTPHKGRIEILVFSRNDRFIEIMVKDTGIGMDETTLRNIFRIDSLVSTPGTDGEPSSGLGLILCREYITRHNGHIWIESEINKGTCVHITLPVTASIN